MPSIWVNSILSFIRLFLVFGNQEKSQSNVNSSWPHSFMRRLDQKGKQQKPLWPFYSFIKHFLAFILRDLFFSLFPVYSLFFEIITLAFCYDCCCCFPVITIIFPLKFLLTPTRVYDSVPTYCQQPAHHVSETLAQAHSVLPPLVFLLCLNRAMY